MNRGFTNDAFQTHKGGVNSGGAKGAGPVGTAAYPGTIGGPLQNNNIPKAGLQIGQRFATSAAWAVSFFLFVFTFALLSFTYHTKSDTYTVAVVALAIAALYGYPSGELRLRQSPWRWMPLLACGLSVVLGLWLGETNYANAMRHYYDLRYGHVYTNVIPTNAARSYQDASLMRFTTDSRVDATKTVGFRSEGALYCVAPIVNNAPLSSATPITFWAIGKDCCDPRTKEFTCVSGELGLTATAAEFEKAKTATLATFDRWSERHERMLFLKAVKMANARFSLPSLSPSDRILLLNWTLDPVADVLAYHHTGFLYFWLLIALFAVFYATAGMVLKPHLKDPANPFWKPDTTAAMQMRSPVFDEYEQNSSGTGMRNPVDELIGWGSVAHLVGTKRRPQNKGFLSNVTRMVRGQQPADSMQQTIITGPLFGGPPPAGTTTTTGYNNNNYNSSRRDLTSQWTGFYDGGQSGTTPGQQSGANYRGAASTRGPSFFG